MMEITMSIEILDQLLADVGHATPEIEAVARVGDSHWTIHYDGEELDIEYNAADSGLMLFSDLGTPDPERAFDLYEAVLMAGLLWRETGGMRVALDGPGGRFLLLYGFSAERLDASNLVAALSNFSAKARALRIVIRQAEPKTIVLDKLIHGIRV